MAAQTSRLERALVELGRHLQSDQLITDGDVLDAFAGDESEAQRVTPEAAVRARSARDVRKVLEVANRFDIPVTPRGGGTGRTGGAVPVQRGIVLAFEGMRSICEVHREDLVCVVEPGAVLADVHAAVEAEGLFYPPDPNSLSTCTLGGNLAENAGGPRAFKYGVTRDYALGLEVVAGAGTPLSLGKRTVKGVTGYDLAALVVGSEGTLGVITRATLKLVPKPETVVTMLVLLPDVHAAGRAVSSVVAQGLVPRCLELLDGHTLDIVRPEVQVRLPEEVRAALLVELDGLPQDTERDLERCGNAMLEAGAVDVLVARHGGEREQLWSARRELSRAVRKRANYKLSEDVVVPRSQIPALLEHCAVLSERYQVPMPTYGHAGDGNLHVNFLWDAPDDRPRVEQAIEGLFREVVRLGGTLSGEHGIGLLKAPYLDIEQSRELITLQKQVKALFDPRGVLNPGKIFAPSGHGSC